MEPSADHLIQRAWAAYQSDYHELAEREARGALVIEPNHAEASSLLSMCALQRRDRDGAVKFASQAIESAPHFAIFHYRLALIHGRFGDHLKAEPAVQTSLAHDPEFAPAYSLYAWIHHARGDVTTALDTVNEALRFDPNDEHALTLRIELLAEAGFVELSDKAANVALEIYPNSAHVHATIGALKLKHRQHHLAAVHLRESSRLAPGKRLVRNQFVQALEKRSLVVRWLSWFSEPYLERHLFHPLMFGLSMLVVYVDSRRCYGAPFNSTTPYFVLTSALHCLLILAWWAPILVYAADAGAEQRGLLLNRLSLRDRTRLLRPSHLAITFGLAISTVGIFVDTPRLLPLSFAIAGLSFSLMIIEHPLTPIWKLASWCGLILGIYLAVRFVQSPFWLSRSKDAKMPGYDCLFGVLSMVSAAAAFYLHSEKMNWGEDDYAPK